MPAPDVCYFFDRSVECGNIALDAYKYFMFIGETTNADVDSYDTTDWPKLPRTERHMDSLIDQCAYLENMYCLRRNENPVIAPFASIITTSHVMDYIGNTLRDCAISLVNEGFSALTEKATERADYWGFTCAKGHFRRSMNRCLNDLSGQNMDALMAMSEEHRRAMLGDTDELRIRLGIEPKAPDVPTVAQRKALRRSVEFLTRLAGPDTVKVFMASQEVRVAGQRFIYGISKTGGRMGHGSSKLCVYERSNPDKRLFNLCIYTQGVPVADHVASIIMAVRAGDEDEILSIGNAYGVDDADYLKAQYPEAEKIIFPPHVQHVDLGPLADAMIGRAIIPLAHNCYRKPDRDKRIKHMSGRLFRNVMDDLGYEIMAFRAEFPKLKSRQSADHRLL